MLDRLGRHPGGQYVFRKMCFLYEIHLGGFKQYRSLPCTKCLTMHEFSNEIRGIEIGIRVWIQESCD